MKVFDISMPTDTVSVQSGGETSVTFTVTNRSGEALRGLVHLKPIEATEEEWLSVQSPSTIDFEKDASHQIEVGVNPPADAEPGTYKFSLIVASEKNPDEDYVEGVVKLDLTAPEPVPEKETPWPLIVAIGAGVLVLVGLGVLLYVLVGGEKPPEEGFPLPEMVGLPESEAVTMLEALGLKTTTRKQPNEEAPEGNVLEQTPAGQTEVTRGEKVTLVVATRPSSPKVKVPKVTGRSLEYAKGALESQGLRVHVVLQSDNVFEQFPNLDKSQVTPLHERRGLFEGGLSRGTFPGVTGAQKTKKSSGGSSKTGTALQSNMHVLQMERLPKAKLDSIVKSINGTVVKQKPGADEEVAKGTTVTVTIEPND